MSQKVIIKAHKVKLLLKTAKLVFLKFLNKVLIIQKLKILKILIQ